VLDGFIVVVWAVYLIDLFVAAVPQAWTFRGRRGAMRAADRPDVELSGGFALMRLPVVPWEAAFVATGRECDASAARRIEAAFADARPVAIGSTALAVVLLVGLPAIRAGWITPRLWIAAAAITWLATVVVFARAWRRVHARRVPLETWIATLLSPVGASRSVYALYWRALAPLHPLVLAAAACDDEEFVRVARLWRYDQPDDAAMVASLAAGRGLSERLAAAPPADDPHLPRYCPRCGGAYAAFAEACRDCQVPLLTR
jgi:hypothetical protein